MPIMKPTRIDRPIPYGVSAERGAAFAATIPSVRWLEPEESTLVTVEETRQTIGDNGALFRYRRDTNFAGNLTEAIRILQF